MAWQKMGNADYHVHQETLVTRTDAGLELWDPMTGAVTGRPVLPSGVRSLYGSWGGRFFVGLGPEATEPDGAWPLACVDLDAGTLLWHRVIEDPAPAPPEAGAEAWSIRWSQPPLAVAVHGDRTVIAFDPDSGETGWILPARCYGYHLHVVGKRLFVVGWQGLTVVDVATGSVLGFSNPPELREALRPTPCLVYRNRLAVPHESGHIAVYDTADGRLVHVRDTRQPLWLRAVEVDGRVIIGTRDGTLVVFDESIWALD